MHALLTQAVWRNAHFINANVNALNACDEIIFGGLQQPVLYGPGCQWVQMQLVPAVAELRPSAAHSKYRTQTTTEGRRSCNRCKQEQSGPLFLARS